MGARGELPNNRHTMKSGGDKNNKKDDKKSGYSVDVLQAEGETEQQYKTRCEFLKEMATNPSKAFNGIFKEVQNQKLEVMDQNLRISAVEGESEQNTKYQVQDQAAKIMQGLNDKFSIELYVHSKQKEDFMRNVRNTGFMMGITPVAINRKQVASSTAVSQNPAFDKNTRKDAKKVVDRLTETPKQVAEAGADSLLRCIHWYSLCGAKDLVDLHKMALGNWCIASDVLGHADVRDRSTKQGFGHHSSSVNMALSNKGRDVEAWLTKASGCGLWNEFQFVSENTPGFNKTTDGKEVKRSKNFGKKC